MGLRSSKPSVPVAQDVDLGRFMGDWYVIAAIGIAAVESDAFDSLEQYQLAQNGARSAKIDLRGLGRLTAAALARACMQARLTSRFRGAPDRQRRP